MRADPSIEVAVEALPGRRAGAGRDRRRAARARAGDLDAGVVDRRVRERVRALAPHRRAGARPRLRRPQTWQILTPDKAGNYATGTWKAVANSAHARGGAQQHVLKDGRFFVGGGEYIDGPACTTALCNTAEIYDPVANTWKNTANAPHDIGDTGSTTLADGTILESTRAGSAITIYDPTTDTWTAKASNRRSAAATRTPGRRCRTGTCWPSATPARAPRSTSPRWTSG